MIPSTTQAILLTLSAVLIISSGSAVSAAYPRYTNYTVADGFGWHFNRDSNTSVTSYTTLSSSIGDFLIFNTDKYSTMGTTYGLCSIDFDYGNLTSQFGIDDGDDEGGDNHFLTSSRLLTTGFGAGMGCDSRSMFSTGMAYQSLPTTTTAAANQGAGG